MILVTGATGRVGEQVVRTLRGLKLPTRALVRKGSEYYWLNDTGCQFFFGDLRDPQSLSRALRDCQYLVVCSGVRLEERHNNHTSVTIDGHRALFAAAKKRGVQRVSLVSCAGVDRGYEIPSFLARKASEDLLIHSGLDYAILRAPLHEHHFLELAWQLHDKGKVWLPGPGTGRLNPVPTRDLAMMAVASLDLATARNQTLTVGGLETMTAQAAVEAACATVGVDPSGARPLPGPAAALGSRFGRPVRRYANRLAEGRMWFTEDFSLDGAEVAARFKLPGTAWSQALEDTNATLSLMRDPAQRDKRMVHPQFYATVYEPGTARLADLPDGPPPRRD